MKVTKECADYLLVEHKECLRVEHHVPVGKIHPGNGRVNVLLDGRPLDIHLMHNFSVFH